MGFYQNRVVVKVGTSTLTNEMGKSDLRSFDRLACVLSDIQNVGYEVILVSVSYTHLIIADSFFIDCLLFLFNYN